VMELLLPFATALFSALLLYDREHLSTRTIVAAGATLFGGLLMILGLDSERLGFHWTINIQDLGNGLDLYAWIGIVIAFFSMLSDSLNMVITRYAATISRDTLREVVTNGTTPEPMQSKQIVIETDSTTGKMYLSPESLAQLKLSMMSPTNSLLFQVFILALVPLIPSLIFENLRWTVWGFLHWYHWALFISYSLIVFFAAMLLNKYCVEQLGATNVGSFIALRLVSTVVISLLLLGEGLQNLMELAGLWIVLVSITIYMFTVRRHEQQLQKARAQAPPAPILQERSDDSAKIIITEHNPDKLEESNSAPAPEAKPITAEGEKPAQITPA